MQDEFDFLNGANSIYKKGMCISPAVPLEPQLESSIENNANNCIGNVRPVNLPSVIRNEDSSHPITWKQQSINLQEHSRQRLRSDQHRHEQRQQRRLNLTTSKLLLQNSDDPLICHGANNVGAGDDDSHLIICTAPNEENTQTANLLPASSTIIKQNLSSTTRSKPLLKKLPQNGCSLLTKQQLKVKAGLMSVQNRAANDLDKRGHISTDVAQTNNKKNDLKSSKKKGVLKLRFHHQALPPEYLIHYEATQGQLTPFVKESNAKSSEIRSSKNLHPSKLSPSQSGQENVRSWLQKIAAIQRSAQEEDIEPVERIHGQKPTRLELPKTEVYNDPNNNYMVRGMHSSKPGISHVSAVKNEIRLDSKHSHNSEKDQFHSLSLKCAMNKFSSNATTLNAINSASVKRAINFADLPYMGEITLDNSKPRRGRKPKKADICHLIYKNYGTILPGTPNTPLCTSKLAKENAQKHDITDELPLNLCVRDQQCEYLSISSGESENACGIDDVECINAHNLGVENFLETKLTNLMPSSDLKRSVILKVESNVDTNNSTDLTPSFSHPNEAKLDLHPLSQYYQKLLSGTLVNKSSQPFGLPVETIEKDNQLSLKIPIPSGLIRMSKTENMSPTLRLNNQNIDYPDLMSTPSSIKSENSATTSASTAVATSINSTYQIFTPQKRKRSAIFIPPIPTEITPNTPTEVSICKFKFTGGDKPSLEEKKMLSVDSNGNYRYYSGTGDKSTRGFEYFPRESLQNSAGFLPGVNCVISWPTPENGCSINDIPPPSAELSNEILQIPESPTANLLSPASVSLTEVSMSLPTSRLESLYTGSAAQSTQKQSQKIQIIVGSNYSNDISKQKRSSMKDNSANLTVNPLTCHSLHPKKKSRRSTQREKLEKAFREKGYLIQTQQLESAEGATYCKFRQLKKFTRYLFRNWKDYLPEEVHQSNVVEKAFLSHQPLTKNEMTKEVNKTDSFTEQDIQNILERHGFLTTSEVCSQNSTLSSTTNLTEKIMPEQKLVDNIAEA
ncbi:PREDICTED: uncharacterized protein LOC108971555 isoform X2 [Bactrocera latifrons]|nr:PREDICTED: uncharacterized protein LOC108971555 isoform X2 [Bactrocera latifrons]XP_018793250.1 PREDICTED: uncharacterized protein LOC108971555 isoform X2 [Bactrocera latifrons]XP_018793251.1 PREDICTED: uncharacterized protein LOC108971555 isoform X2 [Bactrocera latifrons]